MLFETENLSRSFGQKTAVHNVNMRISAGETVALATNNAGAGERTLLNLISGILDPDSGAILLHEEDITLLPPLQRAQKGLVRAFDESSLFMDLTLADHILAASRNLAPTENDLYSQWKNDSQYLRKGMRRLADIGLDVPMDTKAKQLSPGRRKLLGLGLATLEPFELLIWHDPVRGLEKKKSRDKIQHVINELKRKGITLLFTSNDMEFIKQMADRMLLMDEGEIIAERSVDRPRT